MEHSSANSVLSFIIFNVVALFTHMESLILGDPGEVSRDARMFVVKVYCKTFTEELSVIFFFRIETIATRTISGNAANIEYLQFT